MSKNIDQVFTANPITSNASTDLMYFGQSPYGPGNDAAMTYANFSAQFGAPYTPAALTEVNDTNVTLTLSGSPSTALLHATAITAGWAGQLSLARGGTNANLTASAGSVAYSSASAIAFSAVGASGQLFQSTGTSAPGWTTATYPTTTTINQILYSSAANTVTGLATLNNGVLITGATGVPALLANSGTPGFVLTANSGAPPSWKSITTEGAITTIDGDSGSITPSSGVVTISGGTTGLTTSGSSATLNLTGTLKLANGGTNASLTASNGGIFYSTASAGAILAGTATANLPLLSQSSTAPVWGSFALSLGGALTTAGALTTSGAFGATFTFTNTTSVTFPTSGTLATTSQIPTGAALTESNDTNVTLTLGGSASTALVNAASITAGWTGTLAGSRGGLGAAITASNGGIYYSNATNGALLAGTATANQVLMSGASTTPAWSTATYPATTTINQILYSSSANVIAGLATANSSILTTNGSGVPSFTTALPSGISPYTTVDQASSSVTMAINTQYVIDNGASLVTLTLPATVAEGSIFRIIGMSSGGWKVAQATGQQCHVGSSATTSGTGGSIASTNQYDTIELVCVVANTTFVASHMIGNLTIV